VRCGVHSAGQSILTAKPIASAYNTYYTEQIMVFDIHFTNGARIERARKLTLYSGPVVTNTCHSFRRLQDQSKRLSYPCPFAIPPSQSK
jgi:hypothetical protein